MFKNRQMADVHRQVVRKKLEALGYTVTEIPEANELSADLAAKGPDVGLVVEVKARRDDIERARQFRAGPPGRVIGSHSPIVHDDSLSDVIHHAAKQIGSSQRQYSGLGVLWFRADPELGISHAADKMVTTLLGRRYVNVRKANGIITMAPCYLAAFADFYHYPGIDLAMVEDPEDRPQLLVNPYSRRLDDVRASRIVAVVAGNKLGEIIDLHRLETPTNGYVLWGDFSRKDEASGLAELKKLYPDCDFQFFDMKSSIGYLRMDV
jgi:hypothetical protein